MKPLRIVVIQARNNNKNQRSILEPKFKHHCCKCMAGRGQEISPFIHLQLRVDLGAGLVLIPDTPCVWFLAPKALLEFSRFIFIATKCRFWLLFSKVWRECYSVDSLYDILLLPWYLGKEEKLTHSSETVLLSIPESPGIDTLLLGVFAHCVIWRLFSIEFKCSLCIREKLSSNKWEGD